MEEKQERTKVTPVLTGQVCQLDPMLSLRQTTNNESERAELFARLAERTPAA